MMDILLVQCPCAYGIEMPALGLAYLSAFLKKNNYNVKILDLSIFLYSRVAEEDKEYWKSNKGYCWYLKDVFDQLPFVNEHYYDECIEKILSFQSDILGFSVQNTSTFFTLEIIKRIKTKAPAKKIILGGPNCYNVTGDEFNFKLHYDLQRYADAVVVGEGEQALLNLLRHIESAKLLDTRKGVAIPQKGKWVFTGFSEPIMNLDDLPFPDLDAYDLSSYTDRNALPVMTSRGCVMRCVFCTDTYFWNSYRHRSAGNVVSEISQLVDKYHNKFISFNDSLINGSYSNLIGLCNLLIDKQLKISWGGNCRIDKRMDLALLKKLKASGCEYLILGLESGSDRILKLMRKGFTVKDATGFIRDCNRAGIYVVANWIVGFPGETDNDFADTVNFILKNKKFIKRNTFSMLTVNQFSYLERHKEEFGIVLDGPHLGLWTSDDGENTVKLRNSRLQYLEDIEAKRNRDYQIVRQVEARFSKTV